MCVKFEPKFYVICTYFTEVTSVVQYCSHQEIIFNEEMFTFNRIEVYQVVGSDEICASTSEYKLYGLSFKILTTKFSCYSFFKF